MVAHWPDKASSKEKVGTARFIQGKFTQSGLSNVDTNQGSLFITHVEMSWNLEFSRQLY
jgi:hypothetical protein